MTDIDWATRIQAARSARNAARSTEEQIIRDAVHDGYPIKHIANALGQRNRQRLYDVLHAGPDGEAANPPASPLVYLRGAGRKPKTWNAVEQAMWLRGWRTTHDRTDSWHAARSGIPVVLADFSTDLDNGPGPYFGYHRYVHVARLRARYGIDPVTGGQDMEFPGISCQRVSEPPRSELPDLLATLVGAALDGTLPDGEISECRG